MIDIEIGAALLILVFSLYRLFISNTALEVGVSVLRVLLSFLVLVALRFEDLLILTTGILLFSIVSLFVLAIIRNEVQIKHD